eukprot:4140416-Pyramimonas_sp.AAC.1
MGSPNRFGKRSGNTVGEAGPTWAYFWVLQGRIGGHLERLGSPLGRLGGPLGAVLGAYWAVWGPCWRG